MDVGQGWPNHYKLHCVLSLCVCYLLPLIDLLRSEYNSKNIFKSLISKSFTKIFKQTQFTPSWFASFRDITIHGNMQFKFGNMTQSKINKWHILHLILIIHLYKLHLSHQPINQWLLYSNVYVLWCIHNHWSCSTC